MHQHWAQSAPPTSASAPAAAPLGVRGRTIGVRVRQGLDRLQAFLPSGGSLPSDEFEARHRLLVRLLWSLVLLVPAYSVAHGGYSAGHLLLHAAPVAACAVLASRGSLPARYRAIACALGLLTAAALGVHISDGLIEAHFSFFVVVILLTLYEDWWPFLLAVVFTLVHHGLMGSLDPNAVFASAEEAAHPWKWAAIHAVFIALAGAGGLITWRLNESVRARMRAMVEQVPAVTYVLDCTGAPGQEHWAYLSPRAFDTLGLEPAGGPRPLGFVLDHVHPEDRAAVVARIGSIRAGEQPEPIDFRFLRPDGRQAWLRDHGTVVNVNVDARRRRVQGLIFDVTREKSNAAEHERMEQELRLAQKLESVGQLAAGVAHEINTPIQFVGDTVGFLETAFEDLMTLHADMRAATAEGLSGDELVQRVQAAESRADIAYLEERVPAALDRAGDGIRRVGTIVRAMREFAHPPTSVMAPVDLNEALRNTLIVAASEFKYVADAETDLDAALPPVVCNAGELNQVFLNLVVNAAHAITTALGDSGGRGLIRISTRTDGSDVVVTIADSGCGIPPDIAARVFDPFFTTKEVGQGTGQGLAIARTLVVERHAGALTFESSPETGTTFHVRLPVNDAASETATATALAA
jgi:signal transduction histidine kinase